MTPGAAFPDVDLSALPARVRFPGTCWAPKRHFLLLTHESTGEFLADDVSVEFHPDGLLRAGGYDRVAHQVLQRALDATVPTMLPAPGTPPAA